jgi:hypothetical protein
MQHHPFMDQNDLFSNILNGYARVFIATDKAGVLGFAAVEVLTYPSRKVANVLAAGGKRGFISVLVHELLEELEKWAREQGADTFAVMGRPGWLKFAKSHGAQSLTVVTSWKRLGDEWRRRPTQQADDGIGTVEWRSGAAS